MKLDIRERDIDSNLCRICAGCCRITFKLRGTNSRYRRFLRQVGYDVLPRPAAGQPDCCEDRHDARADMGYCKFLEVDEQPGGTLFACQIYETSELPELCADFNCVSWAKANDSYNQRNPTLVRAQKAFDRLRSNGHAA